ncbi:hypothetical protein WBP07_17870 [Novosphingobium sp. BL-8A]|uniref:hypothetical protein n=1 Tax=Novosphingobium sp. BL-8A TaxID=3127639 RepID=UPI0037579AE0
MTAVIQPTNDAHYRGMYVVPAHFFNPLNVRAGIDPRVISGGTSLSGEETVIQMDGGGKWRIEWAGINIDDPGTERLWDMWISYLAGGSRAVLVPILSLATAPRPYVGGVETDPSGLAYDDEAFPTFVRFASPHIVAHVVSPVALRATTIEIEVTQGARIRGGEKLSISGNRAHLIERVISRAEQRATCVISPPTRTAIPAGAEVNFEWPVVQCRAEVGQSLIPMMEFGRFSEVSISFVEDFSDAD